MFYTLNQRWNLKHISICIVWLHSSLTFACFLFISAENLVEDLNTAVPKMPSESAIEDLVPKVIIYFVALHLLKK